MLLATSCGGKKQYKIDGTIEGIGTQNVTALYYDGNTLREMTTNAVNSSFHIEGSVGQPVVMEFYDNQRRRIGCVVVANGDEIKVGYKIGDPYFMKVEGNDMSEALASFISNNSANLNDAIEKRLESIPADDLSAILAGYYYDINIDPLRADSLLSKVNSQNVQFNAIAESRREIAARMGDTDGKIKEMRLYSSKDTLINYAPSTSDSTLFIFTDLYSMPDSILHYADSVARDMRVASVRLNVDSFGWHKDAARFSKKVDHLWAIGGVANPHLRQFNIPRIPYFIVTDTAANQIYRGDSLPDLRQK